MARLNSHEKGRTPCLSIISLESRGAASGVFGTEICVQELYSKIIWSNPILPAIQASTTPRGVIPGTRISAAQPRRCWLVSLEPTASFTSFYRNPLFTMTGLPPTTILTRWRSSASRLRFAISCSSGVLSQPLRSAASERVSSSRVKLAESGVTGLSRRN